MWNFSKLDKICFFALFLIIFVKNTMLMIHMIHRWYIYNQKNTTFKLILCIAYFLYLFITLWSPITLINPLWHPRVSWLNASTLSMDRCLWPNTSNNFMGQCFGNNMDYAKISSQEILSTVIRSCHMRSDIIINEKSSFIDKYSCFRYKKINSLEH